MIDREGCLKRGFFDAQYTKRDVLGSIELAWIIPYEDDADFHRKRDEFRSLSAGKPLSAAYALLNDKQKAEVRRMIDKPAVGFTMQNKAGKRVDPLNDGPQALIARLAAGEFVGPVEPE